MTKLEELIAKLSELFELDKADLDFGIHRIIKSKHRQVREYLETRLPNQVEKHIGELAAGDSASQLEELREQVTGSFGADAINEAGEINEAYAKTPLGEKYKVIRESSSGAQQSGNVENEVYSHLLEFFSRYYEDADFMSLRRRTAGRESYSIPCNGEEVVLHWANKDQYYIKSSEDLKDYTFTVPLDPKDEGKKGRVQFRLTRMDAVPNNNNASRFFQLDEDQEITATDDSLVIPFHFAEGKKRAKAAEAEWEGAILELLPENWAKLLGKEDTTYTGSGDRNVLQKHLRNYTKKNTSDYFIHKDLGGFLRRELDFYVKNEVIFLDDIENRPASYIASELRKIKAIRAVAHDLIDFMKQFEDFQKKLWLKKKFVVETNWCITIDRIPKELYPTIAANDAQREEWVKLFSIDEIEEDPNGPGYTEPLTNEFLLCNSLLPVETRFFSSTFFDSLVHAVEDLDDFTGGYVFEGDNFHSLCLATARFSGQLRCSFIDPPYNTGGDDFIYKDSFQHSSWMTMMHNRLALAKRLLPDSGSISMTIDDDEVTNLRRIASEHFGDTGFIASVIWQKKYSPQNDALYFSDMHDYVLVYCKDKNSYARNLVSRSDEQTANYKNPDDDERGPWTSSDYTCSKTKEQRPNLYYPIKRPADGKEIWPNPNRVWGYEPESHQEHVGEDMIWWGKSGLNSVPRLKVFISNVKDGVVPSTWWTHEIAGHNDQAKKLLSSMFGRLVFETPKPLPLLQRLIEIASDPEDFVLDFFAGSGSTAHAIIDDNRSNAAARKYVLAETAEFSDLVLKPRILKAAYSKSWNDGKPVDRIGVSHSFKTLRLESYEDTLNNLTLDDQSPDLLGQPQELKDEYLLRYCLNTETSGSLLDCEQFKDPFNYLLKIYDRETGEAKPTKVDLPETFNYLLGLKVRTMQMKGETLVIEGENPAGETVLVIWRNVDEMDNKKLEKFVSKTLRINTADTEYAAIYINGDTTLNDPHKKILLTEQVFHDLMFDVEDV